MGQPLILAMGQARSANHKASDQCGHGSRVPTRSTAIKRQYGQQMTSGGPIMLEIQEDGVVDGLVGVREITGEEGQVEPFSEEAHVDGKDPSKPLASTPVGKSNDEITPERLAAGVCKPGDLPGEGHYQALVAVSGRECPYEKQVVKGTFTLEHDYIPTVEGQGPIPMSALANLFPVALDPAIKEEPQGANDQVTITGVHYSELPSSVEKPQITEVQPEEKGATVEDAGEEVHEDAVDGGGSLLKLYNYIPPVNGQGPIPMSELACKAVKPCAAKRVKIKPLKMNVSPRQACPQPRESLEHCQDYGRTVSCHLPTLSTPEMSVPGCVWQPPPVKVPPITVPSCTFKLPELRMRVPVKMPSCAVKPAEMVVSQAPKGKCVNLTPPEQECVKPEHQQKEEAKCVKPAKCNRCGKRVRVNKKH